MNKEIKFARVYPCFHPKKGEPTGFIEKFLQGALKKHVYDSPISMLLTLNPKFGWKNEDRGDLIVLGGSLDFEDVEPKYHTIRENKRWKEGDYFTPKVWSGRPFWSTPIIIAPDIRVERTWDFEVTSNHQMRINGKLFWSAIKGSHEEEKKIENLPQNDGLEVRDLLAWFKWPKPFKGQIVCWNEDIRY
jgi:hypothetical protein